MLRIICISTLIILGSYCAGQNFSFEPFVNTDNSSGVASYSYIKFVETVNDSTIIVGGEFSNTLTINSSTVTATNSQDIFIGSLNQYGEVRWLKKIGSDVVGTSASFYDDEIMDLQIDKLGNIIICGYVGGNAMFNEATLSENRGSFIAQMSAEGEIVWTKVMENYFSTTTGDNQYRATTIAVTDENNIILGGIMIDSLMLDGMIYKVDLEMNEDISRFGLYYMSLDPLGNVNWVKTAKGGAPSTASLNQTALKIIFYEEELYAYGLYSSTSITFDSSTLSECCFTENLFIAKFDLLGNLIWAKSSKHLTGSPTSIGSRDVLIHKDKIVISGEYTNPIGFDDVSIPDPSGLFDFFIGSFNLDGEILSLKNYGGENTERLNHLSIINDTLYGFGHYDTSTEIEALAFNSSIEPSTGAFMFNPFYIKLNDDFIPTNGEHLNLEEEEFIYQNRYNRFTSVTSNGTDVYFGGIYKGNLVIDDVNYLSTGQISSFILKSGLAKLSSNVILNFKNEVKLFPNPIDDFVYLRLPKDESFHLTISNVTGELLDQLDCRNGCRVSLKNYPSGVYLIEGVSWNGLVGFVEKAVKK